MSSIAGKIVAVAIAVSLWLLLFRKLLYFTSRSQAEATRNYARIDAAANLVAVLLVVLVAILMLGDD